MAHYTNKKKLSDTFNIHVKLTNLLKASSLHFLSSRIEISMAGKFGNELNFLIQNQIVLSPFSI